MSNMILTICTANLGQLGINTIDNPHYKHPKHQLLLKSKSNRILYKYPSLQKKDNNFDRNHNCPLLIPNGYYKSKRSNLTNLNIVLYKGLNQKLKKQLPSINLPSKHVSIPHIHKCIPPNERNNLSLCIQEQCDLFTNVRDSIDSFAKSIKVKNVNKDPFHSTLIDNDKLKEKMLWLTMSRNINDKTKKNNNSKNINYSFPSKTPTLSPFLKRNLSTLDFSTISELANQSNTIKFKEDSAYLRIKKMDKLVKKIINEY